MDNLPKELNFEFKDTEELEHIMEQQGPPQAQESEINMEITEDAMDEMILDVPNIEKEPINSKDIFITEPDPEPEVIVENKNIETNEVEPNFEYEDDVIQKVEVKEPVKPVKLNKNGKPRKKRVYTEEQRKAMCERLARAREIQLKNKGKKKIEKEKKKTHTELKKKTIDMEITEMENKLNGVEKETKQSFTKEDLEQAQLNAIVNYEKIRKQRKQKKKEEQMIAAEKKALQDMVKSQLANSWESTAGRFAGCY